jgi:Tol biopolymer transport system component
MKRILLIACLMAFSNALFAQWDRYHPEYNWFTIKGKHVQVHFHEGAERTAKIVAKIADEVWRPLTRLYHYDPGVVHFVIKDIDDYSNGATYFFDNKIEIWASALDYDLRGAHNWLRNVISHEFTHMVQIQASMKTTRRIPAVYLQYMNYEDKRRPDVLYGFPNFIASYPVAMVNVPSWFAEGTAQYMRKEFNYDNWDTHRDMILRCYALDNNMLTWNQMGVFGKTSLGNESVYNSGFSLVRYISQKYGEDKLRKISEALGSFKNFTIDAAFEDVLGKDGNQIYREWSSYLKKDYKRRSEKVLGNLVQGKEIIKKGFGNFYPLFSPDGKKVYYISNKSEDYFSLSGIYARDLKTGKDTLIRNGVRSTFSILPDGRILYAKLSEKNENWINIHDLYVYDMKKEEEKRITRGLRANNPSLSHDGRKVVFVFQKDGTSNLGIVNIDGSGFKRLTFFENGEQVYNPKFGDDDSFIVFDYSYHEGRDIARVDTNGANFEFVLNTTKDERNPVIKNGKLYYSCDENGIFNLYEMDLSTGKRRQLTNVIGGAFMPDVANDGKIVYAGYVSTGYKIFLIAPEQSAKVNPKAHYIWKNDPPLGKDKPNGDFTAAEIDSLSRFNDYDVPNYKLYKYRGAFTRMSFFPFVRYDNYTTSSKAIDKIKPGLYFTSSDMLNRYSIFGGGAINKRMERDLFLSFEYRDRIPLLYGLGLKPQLSLEIYSVSRKSDVEIVFDPTRSDYIVPTDVTYDLFQVDVAAKQKIIGKGHNLEFRFSFSKYSAALGSFIIPHTTTLYPSMSDDYFIGRSLQLKYDYKSIHPSRDMDINPVGREVEFKYSFDFDKYNPDSEYRIEDGVLVPVFKKFNFHKVELNWKEHFEVANSQTLTLQFRGGTVIGPALPSFFDFYLGGLIGMKSYPFYAISGNSIGWLNLTYRFPLFKNIDERIGHLYLDKIFLQVFGDVGDAWTGKMPGIADVKKGAGVGFRIKLVSFYIFPTSLFFNAAYSFDKFSREVFGEKVTYGKEWRFYGGILFDFGI